MKLIDDILKEPCGKWSLKRIVIVISFLYALGYELTAMVFNLISKEYVFGDLLLLIGAGLGLTLWAKKKIFNEN